MSECYRLICDDCKVTLWVGEEINEGIDTPEFPRKVILYRHEDGFDPVAKFLEDHEDHHLMFRGQETPGFFEGYRELDSDDPLQGLEPLDSEQRQWVLDDPSLRHPRD